MAQSTNDQYALNQQVSFIQHFLPGLDAGSYELDVSQQVLDSDGNPVSGKAYNNSYKFGVTADRFTLSNPGNIVSSNFPADNATGEFSNVLPHVVFKQKTFPWVRYPTTDPPYAPPNPGEDTDADVPTWLWVMLLDEEDVQNYPALDLNPANRTVGDLFPKAAVPTTDLGDNYSYFNGATTTDGLGPGEMTDQQIRTIDVPLALIWDIAPTIADLAMMAHGRVVSLVNQPADSNTQLGEPTGTFSIAFGNRLPETNRRTTAFLVSLEKLQPFLPDAEGGGAPAGNGFDGTKNLRLAVLRSWTFFSVGQPATFVNQLEALNGRAPDGPPASNTNVRLGYAGTNAVVAGALDMGYVPLNEVFRNADKSVSWYRGPLLPYKVPTETLKLPIPSPDAAMIFDPTTGMLDVSYAAAWSIGRLVALQDKAFSTGLYAWKKGLDQQVSHSLEDNMLEERFGVSLNQGPPSRQLNATEGRPAPHGSGNLRKRTIIALNPEEQRS